MFFHRFYNQEISQASFLIGCKASGEAIVIDPTREIDQYVELAKKERLKIVAVTETHIHADYVSGSRELGQVTGATVYLSSEGGPDWKYEFAEESNVRLIGSGDEINVGKIVLRAVHTPGHTPEHLLFLLIDGATTTEPVGALSGDFIFAGDVGRPDLLEVAAGFKDTMRQGAETLFRTIRGFDSMPDRLLLWPGHGAGSACGKALGGAPVTTLGYERIVNAALKPQAESAFVDDILSAQPEPPKYFARMKAVNRKGPEPARHLMAAKKLQASRLADFISFATLVDIRSEAEFIGGSVTGALSIEIDPSFAKYAGSLIDPKKHIVLIAKNEEQAVLAQRTLVIIGLENCVGWLEAGSALDEAKRLGKLTAFPVVKADQVSEMVKSSKAALLDVRGSGERAEASIEGSLHVPSVYLSDAKDLPSESPILVHCAGGSRALIGASYLRSKGFEAVAVMDSFSALSRSLGKVEA